MCACVNEKEFVVSSVWVCNADFFFTASAPWVFGIRGCVCVHFKLNEITDLSGVRFHVHPAAAVILAPRGQISSKTDKKWRFPKRLIMLVKKQPGFMNRSGKSWKLHEKLLFQVSRNLEGLQINIWEKFGKQPATHLLSHIVSTPGQNLQIKHLDRVWNFKWKICRES